MKLSAEAPEPVLGKYRVSRYFWVRGTAMLVVSLGTLFFPMLRSGFERVPGDMGDARLVNYLLEHSYLWMTRRADHASFWNPPVAYPQRNVAAQTETMLGSAPCYWVWRAIGLLPDTSFQLWLLVVAALDFVTARAFLKRALGCSEIAAGTGAFLFVAAAMRARQLNHPQTLVQFPSMVTLYALVRVGNEPGSGRTGQWWLTAASAFVLQLWGCFYLAWFLALGLLLFVGWSMVFETPRRVLARIARRDWRWVALCGALVAFGTWPLILHSMQAVATIHWRPVAEILMYVPSPHGWFAATQGSLLAKRLGVPVNLIKGAALGWASGATAIALLALSAVGIHHERSRMWFKPAIVGAATLVLLATQLRGGHTLWMTLLPWFPGAGAIRAVSRCSLVVLIPWSLAIVGATEAVRQRLPWLVPPLVVGLVLSQVYAGGTYSKAEARHRTALVVAQLSKACHVFTAGVVAEPGTPLGPVTVIFANMDALGAQAATGIPTTDFYGPEGVVPSGGEHEFAARARERFTHLGLRKNEGCVVLTYPASGAPG
jgi:hypothetical protein